MSRVRLVSGFVTTGGWTLASRILGFVREVLIAATLGAGPVAEAFLVAFSLPNMFRRFFAEGTLNPAFVPIFAKKVEAGEDALGFARDAFSALAGFLLVFTLLAQVAMPWLVLAMASGFAEDERFALATHFGRITFPYILFIALAALASGVLNALGRFAAAAAAPVLLNLVLIATMLLGVWLGWPIGPALAWAVPLAGAAQLALVWNAARRAGYPLVPHWPVWTPELRRLARLAAPAALAGGVVQVNLLIGRQVSSYFEGAVAWLYYADRLYQLPLGVVGVAIGVVLLPDLSRRLRAGDATGGKHVLSRAAEIALALTIPCSVALVVVPGALVAGLFERGAFSPEDTARTALAAAVYGLGLPAFVLQKVLQPVWFARENTRTPFNFALVGLVVNAALAIGLAPLIGFIAAAIAAVVSGWAMTLLYLRGSRGFGDVARFDARFTQRLWRIIAASLGMGAALWLAQAGLAASGLSARKLVSLAVILGVGGLSYGLLGQALGAFRLGDFRAALRRG